jgi:hypothetical protein
VLFADAWLSDAVYSKLCEKAGLVFLSLISTSEPARARYLVQRIRRCVPRAKVLIGLWGLPPAELAAAKAAFAGSVDVVTTLRDAVAEAPALVGGLVSDPGSLASARFGGSDDGVAAG